NLEGGLGSNLIDGVWQHGDGGDAFIAKMIIDGLPESGMPGFGAAIDAPRIRALTVFLRGKASRAKERPTTYARPTESQISRSQAATFRVETIASGLDIPWSIAFVPGTQDILIAEKNGRLLVLRDGKLLPDPITDTPKV